MKKHFTSILLAVILIAGLSLLLYPSFSNWWNSFHQSRAITQYAETVAGMDTEEYEKILNAAKAYNEQIAGRPFSLNMSESDLDVYNLLLNVGGSGIMGYIEIKSINCFLPIYHGTDESVLQIAIGHIPGTSLPVGGESTHCVLSGHRGLPSARLFTDIDKLVEGDTFTIRTLDETLTYEVDQILIVLPEEVSSLKVEEGKDLCTLVTCTPYGVNTHRLLVRGHRIATVDDSGIRVTADAIQIDPLMVAPAIGVPMILLLVLAVLLNPANRKRTKKERAGKEHTGKERTRKERTEKERTKKKRTRKEKKTQQ